jgi:nicotinamide-nucleotide amidase
MDQSSEFPLSAFRFPLSSTSSPAEIIAIGTELLTGAKLDTNSQWLSRALGEVGIPVRFHQTMGDDLPAMVAVLRAAVDRSDLVLITGGLGPTRDDLTRDALAELAGVELVQDDESLEHIRRLFADRGRVMPERNVIQAMFPRGSEPLKNPRGTAPGIWLELPRPGREPCRIAAMPGVPSEMKPMFLGEVVPRLPASGRVIRHACIHCFGGGESHIEELLGELTARGHDPEVGITAHEATITLRIAAEGLTEAECIAKIESTRIVIRERLAEMVFGEEDEELQDVLLPMLRERGETLATAEAGTGGLLAELLTGVPGSGDVYLGGVVAPTDAAKAALLGAPVETLREHGLASEAVALAMAAGCRERCGSDYALAVTAFGSVGATGVPRAWVALSGPDIARAFEHVPVGDPAIARSRAAKTALDLLRRHLRHVARRGS